MSFSVNNPHSVTRTRFEKKPDNEQARSAWGKQKTVVRPSPSVKTTSIPRVASLTKPGMAKKTSEYYARSLKGPTTQRQPVAVQKATPQSLTNSRLLDSANCSRVMEDRASQSVQIQGFTSVKPTASRADESQSSALDSRAGSRILREPENFSSEIQLTEELHSLMTAYHLRKFIQDNGISIEDFIDHVFPDIITKRVKINQLQATLLVSHLCALLTSY